MTFTSEQLKTLDDFVYKTCVLAVQHIKNVVELRKTQDTTVGYHSRLLERLLHPENVLIYKGTSRAALDKSVPTHKEHIVPMVYLQNSIWTLIEEGEESDEQLAQLLKNHLGIAIITKAEAHKLDTKPLSLKRGMPKGWRLGVDDPLDRLHAADVVLLDDDHNEVKSLLPNC